jgi:hypothetical protein
MTGEKRMLLAAPGWQERALLFRPQENEFVMERLLAIESFVEGIDNST